MTRTITVTTDDICTIRLALIGWSVRCKQEAEQMEKWALEMPHHCDKCKANAAVSRQMKADADDTLARIK